MMSEFLGEAIVISRYLCKDWTNGKTGKRIK